MDLEGPWTTQRERPSRNEVSQVRQLPDKPKDNCMRSSRISWATVSKLMRHMRTMMLKMLIILTSMLIHNNDDFDDDSDEDDESNTISRNSVT